MTQRSPMLFALKVVGLSLFLAPAMLVFCLFAGLFLYTVLDPRMSASDLSNFMIFFLPFAVFGAPAIIASSRLALLRRRPWLVTALLGVTFILGTLGFAGFMVGAMGI